MKVIVGVDEVGRGCWAGPLVAGAVILQSPVKGLKDSKKLTAMRRNELSDQIEANSIYALGWVLASEVDELGLTKAVSLAMTRAIDQITTQYDQIIVDGNFNFLSHLANTTTLIGADNLIPEVSAASILAKVARDKFMIESSASYPGYGFESHVGYGTKQHLLALQTMGITDLHRQSYKPVQACI